MPDAALLDALERDEFEVYYQPRLSISTGRIVSVEALLRWAHPRRGLVLPMRFVPEAERAGLMEQIENWVMEEAFRQAKIWRTRRASHSSLAVSVNLSAERFGDRVLVGRVESLLDELRLAASGVQLEITHYKSMDYSQDTIDTLLGLKALGVRIVVDNFGAGYSSLSYLHRFPADYLSIDKSFVDKLGEDKDSAAIVEAIRSLARTFDLQVIGKGVENVRQLQMLREIGCEMAQGNYFSEPVPDHRMSELLR